MHAPDGFLEPPVAVAMALVAVAVLALAVRTSRTVLGDRQIPLAGVSAAFVFAAQMVNFPVAAGTSGHLLGGALAAILLGPWVGALVVTVVVVVQALVFADGGLTALGYNVVNMAIVPAFGGWAVFHWCRRVLPRSSAGVVGAAGVAAGVSVVLSAMTFSLQWLFGASAPVAFDTVFGAMVGVHVLIGIGEGIITGLVVSTVLATRPDLVAGAADLSPAEARTRAVVGRRPFVIGAVVASIVVAVVVSQFASGDPDGLERVAEEEGFAEAAQDHGLADSVFADYATRGIDNEELSLAVAGATGVGLTLVVGWGLASAPRRLRPVAQPAAR
jgi:cobalt/nickel transport system permease protein